MTTKPDEVILHISAIVAKLVCREIVLSPMQHYHFYEDGIVDSVSDAILDERGQTLSIDHESITQIEWKQVKEKTTPEPSRFQVHNSKLLADLRAAIAPNGPTAEQVDNIERLLDAIPEGWWRLLPLPTCEPEDDSSCFTLQFTTRRAALTAYAGLFHHVSIASSGDEIGDVEFTVGRGDWLEYWHNCLRWFVGESLEV